MAKQNPPFNPNVKPVEYDVIVQWVNQKQPVWIPKLGRSVKKGNICHFWCSITSQGLIKVSANEDGTGSSYVYSKAEWNQICNNIQWAINTGRDPELTYWYNNHPSHPEAPRVPNHLFGPNVPAICRAFYEATLDHIILRPIKHSVTYYRLGLFTADFNKYARGQNVKLLRIDLGKGLHDIQSIKTYVKYGSLTDSTVINSWLQAHGYTDCTCLLEFRLEIDMVKQAHTYIFIKKL